MRVYKHRVVVYFLLRVYAFEYIMLVWSSLTTDKHKVKHARMQTNNCKKMK